MPSKPDPQTHQQLTTEQRTALRCLADIQKVELRDGDCYPSSFRFDLTHERMAQTPVWN